MEDTDSQYESVSSNVAAIAEAVTEMVFIVLNVAFTTYVFIRMRTTKMIHKNLRTMLLSFTMALEIFNLVRLWRAITFLVYVFLDDRSPAISSYEVFYYYQCWFARAVYDTTINVFAVTMTVMAIERIVATVAVNTYEQRESDYVANILIASQWIVAIAVALTLIILDVVSGQYDVTTDTVGLSCSLVFTHPLTSTILFLFGVVGFFGFAVVLVCLYRYNSKEYQKKGSSNLAVRYQLAENVATLRFLIPIVVCFGVMFVAALADILFINTKIDDHEFLTPQLVSELLFFAELYNICGVVFTFTFCFMCVCLHTPLRATLKKDLARFSKQTPTKDNHPGVVRINGVRLAREDEGDVYFRTLTDNWKR